jgi:hypothetical protein
MAKPKTKICPKGHDKDIVGRDSQGRCKQCRKERPSIKKHRKKVCPKGHKISVVGRDKSGACNGCKREHRIKWGKENQEYVQEYNDKNREHKNELSKKWRQEHKEEIKQYFITHKEEFQARQKKYHEEHRQEIMARVKKWQEQNPKLRKIHVRKCLAKRNGRIVAWTDWKKIDEFERHKPEGMTTDHHIPLNGKLVWGLHVSWNLQYLPPHDNFTKLNSCNLLEASEWYGKILEEAGLK